MPAPTVAVTVKLFAQDGTPYANTKVTAKLDQNEIYHGFVISDEVVGYTDVDGICVLDLFPNDPNTGLGTTGSVYTIKASPAGGKSWRVTAQVPNSDCDLEDIADRDVLPGLSQAEAAEAAAVAAATEAAGSAAAADTSADAAAASASAAASSSSSASASASTASTAATTAASAAASASTSATNAGTSATSAATSSTNAGNSATAAGLSEIAADGYAASAAASASTATTQAGNAATSASNASTSATAAAGSATAAGTSATNASTSATNAAAAAVAAAASYDSFDDRYLGAKASNPTLDNDGNALLVGALYANTVAGEMRWYDGSAWVQAFLPVSSYVDLNSAQTLTNKTLTAPVINSPTGITAADITNTAAGNIAATTVQAALNELDSEKQAVSGKDASGGYAGLTLFKLNLRNAANTITSWFTTAATAARTWTMPDKDGTVAMTSDITGTNSGTNTGDETTATIKTKLGITTLSGSNTGDQTSIVGITGSVAEFNAALTGADFATGGGTATGTNTGDQSSIVGISGTLAQFNTACSDADFASGGGTATGTNTGDETGARVATLLHAASAKTTLVDADEVNGTDSANSFSLIRTTWANAAAYVFSKLGPLIAAATGKTTPVDADGVLITDSAASGANKFLSFTNLKAFLLTYFNTKGLVGVESISLTSSVTTVMADAGKSFDHPASDANARTVTIDSNANVAYPVGTVLCFSNMTSQAVTIAITSDTLSWIGTGTTGSRTLAQYGQATARKIASTTWQIGGVNLT